MTWGEIPDVIDMSKKCRRQVKRELNSFCVYGRDRKSRWGDPITQRF